MPETDTLVNNPFAALTAVVAPAILTNACSVLALGTGNRLARVVDRMRIVIREMRSFEPGTPEHDAWSRQRDGLNRRSQLLLKALRSFYAALGAFAAAALLMVIGTFFAFHAQMVALRSITTVAFVAGSVAVVALVYGCVEMVRETRLAVQYLAEEARAVTQFSP
ncbi:MAG: DUF2721 domain-containing protein [Luteitalea sp.]|nr:DUF2721 domain-containing protein [Luteitalea sp.]